MLPMRMKAIAVKSYFGMNFSPRILIERIKLTIIAVAALHERSVKSI